MPLFKPHHFCARSTWWLWTGSHPFQNKHKHFWILLCSNNTVWAHSHPYTFFSHYINGYLVNFISLWPQTANYVVRAEDLPRTVPGRTIVYCLKTMARRTSSVRTLQSHQSGFGQLHFTLLNCISLSKNILQGNLWINSSFKECSLKICPAKINPWCMNN